MEETCILCGDIIPEGRQVCPRRLISMPYLIHRLVVPP